MSRTLRFVPLALLLAFVGFVAWRLATPSDTVIRSQLEGKPVPAFTLPPAVPGRATLSSADLASGQPRLVKICPAGEAGGRRRFPQAERRPV